MPPEVKSRVARFVLPLAVATALLLGAVIVLGNLVAHRTNATVSSSDDPRQRYDALYQTGFRSDGGRSVVTADAVFEYPSLVAALAAYPQRGFAQNQALDILTTSGANDRTLAFLVTISAPVSGVQGFALPAFDVAAHAALTDDRSRTYERSGWNELATSSASTRIGIVQFKRTVDGATPEEAGATSLQLVLSDLPGSARTFAWDLGVLHLTN